MTAWIRERIQLAAVVVVWCAICVLLRGWMSVDVFLVHVEWRNKDLLLTFRRRLPYLNDEMMEYWSLIAISA
jgi:hypothetical protein